MLFVDCHPSHLRFIETQEKSFNEKVYVPADRETWSHCIVYLKNSPLRTNKTEKIESLKICYSKIIEIVKAIRLFSSKFN